MSKENTSYFFCSYFSLKHSYQKNPFQYQQQSHHRSLICRNVLHNWHKLLSSHDVQNNHFLFGWKGENTSWLIGYIQKQHLSETARWMPSLEVIWILRKSLWWFCNLHNYNLIGSSKYCTLQCIFLKVPNCLFSTRNVLCSAFIQFDLISLRIKRTRALSKLMDRRPL